jgi:hypothetical protein
MAEETKDGLVMTETQERKDYATAGRHYTKYRPTAFRSVRSVIFIRGV